MAQMGERQVKALDRTPIDLLIPLADAVTVPFCDDPAQGGADTGDRYQTQTAIGGYCPYFFPARILKE
jgi:hypothetical protein